MENQVAKHIEGEITTEMIPGCIGLGNVKS